MDVQIESERALVLTAGAEAALWQNPNPFKIPARVQVEPYGRSVYPGRRIVWL